MKNSNDTIGNRTHDLPTSSAVPQTTAPPRAPMSRVASFRSRSLYPPGKKHHVPFEHGTGKGKKQLAVYSNLLISVIRIHAASLCA